MDSSSDPAGLPVFLNAFIVLSRCVITGQDVFRGHPEDGILKVLERTIIELYPEMAIQAVSKYFHLDGCIAKFAKKRYLKRQFKQVKLGRPSLLKLMRLPSVILRREKTAYWRIVRDLDSGKESCRNTNRGYHTKARRGNFPAGQGSKEGVIRRSISAPSGSARSA